MATSLLPRKTVERYSVALIEAGLRGLAFETAVAVRQNDLQYLRDQVPSTDKVVVGTPESNESSFEVYAVHGSCPDLCAAEYQMVAGNIETVPGDYCGAELFEDGRSSVEVIPSHN